MSQTGFLRARRPEHKKQRREAILAAARELAAESGVRNVSLGLVASAVGLAKSNVVRYFRTREEIYLELTATCAREWAGEVIRRLDAGDDVVDALAETAAERPLFCDLLSHASTTLEHNASASAAADFKRRMLAAVGEVGAAVGRAHPTLTEDEGVELVTIAGGLVGMLYVAANPPPTVREAYERNPDLAGAHAPFLPTLKRLLAALAAGLPSLR